ncbi:MAG: cation:proton antiporter [Thermoleophilia bacterium]
MDLPRPAAASLSRRRLVTVYAVMAALVVAAVVVSFTLGSNEEPEPSVGAVYALDGGTSCLGDPGALVGVQQSGRYVALDGEGLGGSLDQRDGRITGTVECPRGGSAPIDVRLAGEGEERTLTGTLGGDPVTLRWSAELPRAGEEVGEAAKPKPKRSGEETFGRLMLAIAVVILAARGLGALVGRLGQPQVMGEVLAGILLGPTLLGLLLPEVKDYLFPADIVPLLSAAADIGLAFYMFLVGLELDPRVLKGRVGQAAAVSNASVALPMILGLLVALPMFELVGPDTDFVPFALFMGVAMSITAFPVLARILIERRMLKRPVGAMALAAAAIDDVTAWGLLAFASAIAAGGSSTQVVRVVGLTIAFCLAMAFVARPLLSRVSRAYDEAGRVPAAWIGAIFVGVLLSAWLTQMIGVAAIFGAFVMGMVMPRRAELSHDVTRRFEDFVVMLLLPLFFVVTGLKTQIGLLDRPVLWLLALVLLIVAIAGKWLGAMLAARATGFGMRESAALGALMNTRGLTELIVLSIGLELGVITPALFAMLVLMALATTFMAAPTLRLIDPKGVLSEPPEEELRRAERVEAEQLDAEVPEHAILVAPQDLRNLDRLVALAEPLARSQPPRELVLAGLVSPRRITTGLATDDRDLREANDELERRRAALLAARFAVRTVAFTSADVGADLTRLATEQEVDLVLVDGRRPLLGEGVPRGDVGVVLRDAPCDVAVLVGPEGRVEVGPERPVVVPFGGADHDWAALELAAWIASLERAPLVLLGAAADVAAGERDASRLLGNASLLVQQLAGVTAEPHLVPPGRDSILEAARGAGLLVVGLSEDWRSEGLGPVRSTIARSATAPTLLVRRGSRPGALAPPSDMTRFAWSSADLGRR